MSIVTVRVVGSGLDSDVFWTGISDRFVWDMRGDEHNAPVGQKMIMQENTICLNS